MILNRLADYYDERMDIPMMYSRAPVKWVIDLDINGSFRGFVRLAENPDAKKDKGKIMLVPNLVRSSGVKAKLFADNEEYVLGKVSDDPKETAKKRAKREEKVRLRHETFVKAVRECCENCSEKEVMAVKNFLENLDLDQLDIPDDLDKKDTITFRVNDTVYPVNLHSVRKFWAESNMEADKKTEAGECMICGRIRSIANSHPVLIKGVPGGQTAGMAIVSANSNAYESFGLKKSLIAPTCSDCAEKYAKALNKLLKSKDSSRYLGGLKYVFWTKNPTSFSPLNFLDDPDPEEVGQLISSVNTGKAWDLEIDQEQFYTSALSASGGRVVIRDWVETTVGNVKKHLANWFKLQSIVETNGEKGRPVGLYTLAVSLYRDSKDIPPNVPKALLSSAIKGLPLPKGLLFLAIKRNHAEQRITRPRAMLIKMVLNSNNKYKEDYMEKLETDEKNPAYLCGRLLAELENLQKAAIPGISATLTDRFFGTASSAPASVFGRLLRGAQSHLGKLRRDRRGYYEAFQRSLEEIQSQLETFPKTLTLEEQGLFSLGYYHQRAHNRSEAIRHKQEKANKKDALEE